MTGKEKCSKRFVGFNLIVDEEWRETLTRNLNLRRRLTAGLTEIPREAVQCRLYRWFMERLSLQISYMYLYGTTLVIHKAEIFTDQVSW